MHRVSSSPVILGESQMDPTMSACKSSCEAAPKRSASHSWLSNKIGRLRRNHRKSSATFDMTEEIEDSLSTRSTDSVPHTPRLPGGCLKIPTQAMSLQESCHPAIGLDDSSRSVSFGSIDVLVFPLQLGDNPSVSIGPPLAMGSELHSRLSVTVDSYEETRPPRRTKQELAVPKTIREDWLRDEGVARSEFKQREEELLSIKKSRKASARGCCKSQFFLRLFGGSSTSSLSSSSSTRKPKRTSVIRK